jgi:hypothetical protein
MDYDGTNLFVVEQGTIIGPFPVVSLLNPTPPRRSPRRLVAGSISRMTVSVPIRIKVFEDVDLFTVFGVMLCSWIASYVCGPPLHHALSNVIVFFPGVFSCFCLTRLCTDLAFLRRSKMTKTPVSSPSLSR